MTDKQLIKQLKSLKKLEPSKDFSDNCRLVLKKQIENSGGSQTSGWQNFYINIKCLGNLAYRPVVGVASFLIIMIGLSFFAHQWFQASKPDDSLYIARIISERARLTTVLDRNARELMAARFAISHAQDISNILADPEFDFEANPERADKLNEDFSREIAVARENVVSWDSQSSSISPSHEEDTSKETDKPEEVVEEKEEDGIITMAENHKDDQGIEVMVQETEDEEISEDDVEILEEQIIDAQDEVKEKDSSIAEILDEALELFEAGNYQEASEKLREAEKAF